MPADDRLWEGTTRAEDAPVTPNQSHVSPNILVYEEKAIDFRLEMGQKSLRRSLCGRVKRFRVDGFEGGGCTSAAKHAAAPSALKPLNTQHYKLDQSTRLMTVGFDYKIRLLRRFPGTSVGQKRLEVCRTGVN